MCKLIIQLGLMKIFIEKSAIDFEKKNLYFLPVFLSSFFHFFSCSFFLFSFFVFSKNLGETCVEELALALCVE
jgi:hypothetical protein